METRRLSGARTRSARATLSLGFLFTFALHALTARAQHGQPQGDSSAYDRRGPAMPDDFEAWLSAQRDASGRTCNRRAVSALGDRWIVACGESGLWIARRNPGGGIVLVRTDDLGGPVV